MNSIRIKKYNNKKGFTLVEVIVVLVIIAILVAIAVPSVMKYIDDANDIKDDVTVSYLNKATEGYRVRLYGDGKLKKDVFEGLSSDEDRQQALIDAGWIDELQTSIYDDSNYFYWNVDKQRWERKESQSSTTPESDDDWKSKTILRDLYVKDSDGKPVLKTDIPNWEVKTYSVGELVLYNGQYYKCSYPIPNNSDAGYKPDGSYGFWKPITLEMALNINYEEGDIFMFKDKFYKSVVKTSDRYNAFTTNINTCYPNTDNATIERIVADERFCKEVKWNGSSFDEVK